MLTLDDFSEALGKVGLSIPPKKLAKAVCNGGKKTVELDTLPSTISSIQRVALSSKVSIGLVPHIHMMFL